MMTTEISVIVPVFNVEKYVSRCIDSILAQTFRDFECILVDDNSSDNSLLLCEEYAGKDSRIRIIRNKENRGLPQVRKAGFTIASGGYILFVDSDDWIENNMLEKMYNRAMSSGYDIIWCNYYLDKETSEIQKEYVKSSSKTQFIKEVFTKRDFTAAWWNKLIKRDIVSHIIFPHANQSEDIPTIVQLIYYAKNVWFIEDALYHYCLNPESLSQAVDRKNKRPEEVYANLIETIDFLRIKLGAKIGGELEPELSDYINKIKIDHLSHRESRNIEKLFELYPDSNKNIFRRGNEIPFLKKVFFYLASKGILFPWRILEIADPLLEFSHKTVRGLYRLIMPSKLRAKLWTRKNSKVQPCQPQSLEF
jgi:glycosyltransferase involved in cell wall biosynthesis